jgi:ParB family chromosome partitioning protein
LERRRGIRSLIPTGALLGPTEEIVQEVPVERLAPNPFQPRKEFREEVLTDLAESVKEHGILQPLVARRRGEGLELIAGERRLEAAKRAGLQRVPVILREATDQEMLELALVENIQREDINPVEEAEAYHRLTSEFGLTQEQVAERVGKSRPTVANSVRLLSLPRPVLESLRRREINSGHAKALLGLAMPQPLLRTWKGVVRRQLSVRQTEALVARMAARDVPRGTPRGERQTEKALDPNLLDLQEQLTARLSARVRLRPTAAGRGGHIEIEYVDEEDLDRIFWALEASVRPKTG